jgi:hypothetical protein
VDARRTHRREEGTQIKADDDAPAGVRRCVGRHRPTLPEAVNGGMGAKKVQNVVQNATLDFLHPMLGHLQQTTFSGAAFEPMVGVVPEWPGRHADLTPLTIREPV